MSLSSQSYFNFAFSHCFSFGFSFLFSAAASCGDGICDPTYENCVYCPADCDCPGVLVSCVGSKKVALTIDDGPSSF